MPLRLRPLLQSDVLEIDRIWREHHSLQFSVPDLKHRIIDAVAESNGKVVAYGQVEHYAVATFIPDLNVSPRLRVEALQLLMTEAIRGTNQAGIQKLYAFIKNPVFADLICKHYGFERIEDPGEILLREV